MAHDRLSPSGLHRALRCPGSLREEAKHPEDRSSPASIDGTHSHTLLEECLRGKSILDPVNFVGKTLKDHDGEFVVDMDRATRVLVAVNYVKMRMMEIGKCALRSEEKVDAGAWIGRDDCKGSADIQLIGDNVLEVIDYKDGYLGVEVEDNEQLLAYAAGAVYPYQMPGVPIPFDAIRLTVIQPKLIEQGLEPINSWDIDAHILMGFLEKLRAGAIACDDPNAPLIPGEIQCKWCKAKPCTAMAEKALVDAQVLFGGEVLEPQQIAEMDAAQLTNDKLRQIILAKPLIDIFLTAVDEEALKRFHAGNAIPDLKVVRGRGSRKQKATDEELIKKLKGMGVPKDSCYSMKPISIAQAEKLKWTNRKKEEKSLTKKQLETLEKDYFETTPGKMTVVSATDKRKAVEMDAKAIFADVKTEPEAPVIPAWLQ